MDYLSFDIGSSFCKAARGDDVCRFPAVVSVVDTPVPGALLVQGKWYVVGEDALMRQRERAEQPHRGAEYHGSTEQYVQVCRALDQLMTPDVGRVGTCIVNLPYFMTGDQDAYARIRRDFSKITWGKLGADGAAHQRTVNFGHIAFAPQGGGAVCAFFAQGDAPKRAEVLYITTVDIGGHTTDVVTMNPGAKLGQEKIISGASTSIGVNAMGFYNDLIARIRVLPGHSLHSRSFSYFGIMEGLARGERFVRHEGKRVDIGRCIDEAKRAFTKEVEREVANAVSDWWPDVDAVILTGGGASLIDRDTWADERVRVLDAMANVQGQVIALRDMAHPGIAPDEDSRRIKTPAQPRIIKKEKKDGQAAVSSGA